MVLCNRCNKSSTQNVQWRKGELRTMVDHSSVLHAKDRFSKKVSETSGKTGHCMPTSSLMSSRTMRMKESGSSNMQKSIQLIRINCKYSSPGKIN